MNYATLNENYLNADRIGKINTDRIGKIYVDLIAGMVYHDCYQVLLLYTIGWNMSDDTLLMTMLFDFFGDLLTEKQREYYDLYHNEDLSLSEIAEKAGITRQGVYDIITRAEKSLAIIEQKTGVIKRWLDTRLELERAEAAARRLFDLAGGNNEMSALASEIVRSLEKAGSSW